MIHQVPPLGVSTTPAPMRSSSPGGLAAAQPDPSPSGSSAVTGPALTQTISALRINTQVAQLLQGVGGGLENNQMLQLMIGLLILISLLQGSQQPQSASNVWDELASRGDSRAAAIGATATTVSFECTAVTQSAENVDASASTTKAAGSTGQQIDLAA